MVSECNVTLLIAKTNPLKILVFFLFIQVFITPTIALSEVHSIDTLVAIKNLNADDTISEELKNLNKQLTMLHEILNTKLKNTI